VTVIEMLRLIFNR